MFRRILATSNFTISHKQLPHNEPFPSTLTCAHYFLDPLSWMRPELEKGQLDGRLECPKCKTNVGKYAWQGMQCSCGEWVVPGISLTRARIDEVKSRAVDGASLGIRLPPSSAVRKTGPGQQNL